jgi:DNA-binding response OmpR family regulator
MSTPDQRPAILVVDDEDGIRYFLERFLAREGYRVVAVPSGEAALERLASEEFDVALLDLRMKGIGGLDVLAVLRQRWPATSVIMLTAHASLESAVEALRRGAHDYLFKPCKTIDLRESIRSGLIKRQEQLQLRGLPASPIKPEIPFATLASLSGPAHPDRFLQHSGLIVDSVRHIITLDGVLLELSPTEFDLLAYLVSEAPRVVSPQELIREVQGYSSNAREAAETIRAHMYHIRRKTQAVAGRNVVSTLRGVGYTLAD